MKPRVLFVQVNIAIVILTLCRRNYNPSNS